MNRRQLFGFILLVVFGFQLNLLFPVSYGSDTAVSIVNPFNISGPDNSIKTFGCTKNGFSLTDYATTCSFNSIFPVAGPIRFNGGKLYLQSDLILTNTADILDLGSIYGQNHAINLCNNISTFASVINPDGQLILELIERIRETREMYSFDWSYDNKYIASVLRNGTGDELIIYSFNGSRLTKVAGYDLGNSGNSVRWRPSSYYVATASDNSSAKIRLFYFNASSNVLTLKDTKNPSGSYRTVCWQGRGEYMAAGGSTIRAYTFNPISEMLENMVTPTNAGSLGGNIYYDIMKWAPRGSKNDLFAGTSSGNLHLWNYDSSTTNSLNHIKRFSIGGFISTLDLANTSTYLAVGEDGSPYRVRVYEYTAATNSVLLKNTINGSSAISTVNWHPNASTLAVSLSASPAGNEFRILDFNNATYALFERYGIDSTSNVHKVRYSNTDGSYIARSDQSRDFSVYKVSFSPFLFKDVTLFLNGDLNLKTPLTFAGNCTINGRNNRITVTEDGSINVSKDSRLNIVLTDMNIESPSAFSLQGESSDLVFRDSSLEMKSNVLFGDGKFSCYNDLLFTGPYRLDYKSNYTSTIHSNSKLRFENGATLSIGKSSINAFDPICFEDRSASLNFDAATLHITDSGVTIKNGTINIFNTCLFDIDYVDTSLSKTDRCLRIGDGISSANDSRIIIHGNGSSLTCQNGGIIFDNVSTSSAIDFNGQSQLILNNGSFIHVKHPLTLDQGWIFSDTTSILYVDPAAYVLSNDSRYASLVHGQDYYLTGSFYTIEDITLAKNDFVLLTAGNLSRNITVEGAGNKISGVGLFSGNLNFVDQGSTLTWDLPTSLGEIDIALNGGKIIFTKDSSLIGGHSFVGTGTVDLTSQRFDLGANPVNWNSNIYWIGNGGTLSINKDVTLSGIWTFSGSVIINGNQQSLYFEDGGGIVLERGAHITFKDILLGDLSDDHGIICNDNECQITLDYTDISLSGNFLFNKGSLFVYNDSMIKASGDLESKYTFSYESSQTSTIDVIAHLKIGKNAGLSIGRQDSSIQNPNGQPLFFADSTAQLILDGGSLHVTSSGMMLTSGTMRIVDSSNIFVESSLHDYGLVLGDGSLDHDFGLAINPGVVLSITSGTLVYNNNYDDRIIFGSPESAVNVAVPLAFSIKRDLTLKDGTVYIQPGCIPYNVLNNSNIIQDNITHVHTNPYAVHRMKSSGIAPYNLNDGDYYYTSEGLSGCPVLCSSGTSTVGGSFRYVRDVILKNHTVTVHSSLVPSYENNVALNGGTLVLDIDASFAQDKSITGSGDVDLCGNILALGPVESHITSSLHINGCRGGAIKLNADKSLSSQWSIGGTILFGGNGNTLDLTPGGQLVIEPSSNLILEDIYIKGLGSGFGSIQFKDDSSVLSLKNAYIGLDNDFSTTIGGIKVFGPTTIFANDHEWLIDQQGSLTVNGVTLWVDPLDKATYKGISFGSGEISKYLSLTSSGTIKTVTNLESIVVDMDPLEVAIKNNSNTLLFLHRTDSNAIVKNTRDVQANSNAMLYMTNNNSNAILKNTQDIASTVVMLGNNSNAIVKNTKDIRTNSNAFAYGIKNNSNAILSGGGELTRTTSNAFLFCCKNTSNTLLYLANNNSNAIAKNSKNIRINSNTLLYLANNNSNAILLLDDKIITTSTTIYGVQQQVNTLDHGPANIHFFLDQMHTLSYNLNLSSRHFMNITHSTTIDGQGFAIYLTGTHARQIIVANGVRVCFTNLTIFNFSEDAFSIGNNAHIIFGEGTNIKLDPPQQIATTMTFSGNTWFSGVGNALEMKSGGNIIVTPGGHLTMHDMNIFGLSGNNIRCQGDASSITFKNTNMYLSSNYSFTSGRIRFEEDVIISGTNVFEYRPTNINSGIASHSTLYLDTGITFKYAPDNANRDLLGMIDKTSRLYVNGCTLQSTTTGMRLTKGTLLINYINDVINNNAISSSDGFSLGNGNENDDVMIEVMPGGSLNILSGILNYNNVN